MVSTVLRTDSGVSFLFNEDLVEVNNLVNHTRNT